VSAQVWYFVGECLTTRWDRRYR